MDQQFEKLTYQKTQPEIEKLQSLMEKYKFNHKKTEIELIQKELANKLGFETIICRDKAFDIFKDIDKDPGEEVLKENPHDWVKFKLKKH